MGHTSSRAALIYQHAVRERDVAIASALSDAIERVLDRPTPEALGTVVTMNGASRAPRVQLCEIEP